MLELLSYIVYILKSSFSCIVDLLADVYKIVLRYKDRLILLTIRCKTVLTKSLIILNEQRNRYATATTVRS